MDTNETAASPSWFLPTRNIGVDVQWEPWRNLVQQGRVGTFQRAMLRLCSLGLAVPQKPIILKTLYPMALYGVQVGVWWTGATFKLCVLRPGLLWAVGRHGGRQSP